MINSLHGVILGTGIVVWYHKAGPGNLFQAPGQNKLALVWCGPDGFSSGLSSGASSAGGGVSGVRGLWGLMLPLLAPLALTRVLSGALYARIGQWVPPPNFVTF